MARQEEGWPLGLQPLNVRSGFARNGDFSGSISFDTSLTGSPTSSSCSSSDLDAESTGSIFHDRSITLGSLIGVRSILERSKRSLRGRRTQDKTIQNNSCKTNTWFFFSLCSKATTDAQSTTTVMKDCPSLGHFLREERRARRNQSPAMYGPDGFALTAPSVAETNSLFVNGQIAPPRQTSPWLGSDEGKSEDRRVENGRNCCGIPVLFSCICGEPEGSH